MAQTAQEAFANIPSTTATGSSGTTAPASGTVETWTVASSSAFPAVSPAGGTQFHIGDPAAISETIAVTSVSGNTWTVTRGAENSTPVAHATGATFVQVVTAGWLNTVNTRLVASGDATGATDTLALNNAIAALPTVAGLGVGKIRVGAGTFYWQGPGSISTLGPGMYLEGAGDWATHVYHVGSGDLLRAKDTTSPYNSRVVYGGGVTGITFDGSNCSGTPSAALHMGDIAAYHVDYTARNYQGGSTSAGLYLDNTLFWTEQLWGQVRPFACQNAVIFDVTGATTSTNSFARTDLQVVMAQSNANFNGVVLRNGASLGDGYLAIRGNFASQAGTLSPNPFSPANVAAVITLAGTVPAGHPSSGQFSNILASRLDIQVECPSAAHAPQTIVVDAASNVISNCYGIMDFGLAGTNFTPSNWSSGSGGGFFGPIIGDGSLSALGRIASPLKIDAGLSIGHFQTSAMSNNATITTAGRTQTLTTGVGAGVTGIIMQPGTLDGQIITVINQASAGTITFAISGTSNVADGASDIIPALTARMYTWSASTSLWYRTA